LEQDIVALTSKAERSAVQTMRGAAVEFRQISKSYGSFEALKDFDLTIRPGEFLTLLGPSGSGKTTTLMLLAGFEFPTSGRVMIGGQDVSKVPSWRRDQGIVFQSYSLFPHMTIKENLAFPLETRGIARKEIALRTQEALRMVQLEQFQERFPGQLSGGQQQRVALARALVADPPLLLMDEPLGALDKNLREEMQIEIKHIQERLRLTVLYVTHDQEEALTMSDRIVVMNEGKIQQVGAPVELYERPRTRFVAEFFGDVNIFLGSVEASEFRADDESFTIPVCTGAPEGSACGAVRPEKIEMHKRGERPAMNDSVEIGGEVVDVIYLGQMSRYTVRTAGQDVVIKCMAAPRTRHFLIGDAVLLSWQADSFVLLEQGATT